ncbi:multidrug transporter [Bordetella trematum]|uniref:efflux transporter outer membrane subunit n=1 Tax=Bordetella trematum TaxID=123899 RepID=UPI000C764555|nr:efflux transporter outer membrane subunit [Bordetella trematum]AUL48306.1 multidrug transporter [Bordetella trematum]
MKHLRPRFCRGLPFALLTLALAGCSLAPEYERPDPPVAASYALEAGDMQPKPQERAAADIGWRDFFRDPLLQQLIEIALHNNRDLRKAALNVEAARALYRIQRAAVLPNLSVSASGASERTPQDLATSPGERITRRHDLAGVTTAWELDLWGRVRSLNDQALAAYLALEENRIAAQLSLVAEVANAYLTLRADRELLSLTQATLATQKRSYALTAELAEAGNATQLDLRLAEIALLNAQAKLSVYTRQVSRDRNALVLLLGQPPDPALSSRLDAATTLPQDILASDLPVGLPSGLLVRRPDIRAAEQMLRGANANIGAARAAFLPAISLTGSAGTASASLDGLFDSGSGAWAFLPQITLPLFRAGALRANLDAAHVKKRLEIANYEQSIQIAFREVADALAGKRTLDDQIRFEQLAVLASRKAHELAASRFREGVGDYLSVLDAYRSLYGAQQSLIRTRLARSNNLIDLYKALGGGWSEHTVPAPAGEG